VKDRDSQRQAWFDEVLGLYRGRLGRVAQTYAEREADDLLQEILLQVWRSLPGFEERAELGTWCYRIAINTAISWKRKHVRKQVERAASDLDQRPGTNNSTANEAGLLQRFLAELGEVDQAVLLMHLENVESAEIAAAIGVSEGAIRTRMSRLRQKLAAWDGPIDQKETPAARVKEVADG
jgi:RNA polymerase sigma-70 factor (ECF subfamily)